MHLSDKAVEPPGQARADLDIFLDYARRMDFRDKDGQPLPPWHDAESAFEAWKKCSAGRPCDYTGLSYPKLRGGSGIQWPCTAEHPDGTERLYADGQAAKDSVLLALTQRCHPQSLRQMRWANAMLKTLSPQILAS